MSGVKLVAVDMDGTVLDRDSNLPEINRIAFEKAVANGIQIALCTGRTMTELSPCLDRFEKVRYAVLTNGGFVVDLNTGERIHEDSLPIETALEIIETSKAVDSKPEAFIGGKAYLDRFAFEHTARYHIDMFDDLLKKTCIPVDDVSDIIRKMGKGVDKINLFCVNLDDRDRMIEICRKFNAAVTYSIPGDVEINSATASKGRGLEALCRHLSIDRSEVMAFGDSANDLPMLRFAGIPVAMANAIDEAKSIASVIAPSNDDGGVGRIILSHILCQS